MDTNSTRILAAIGDFVSRAQAVVDEHRNRNYPSLDRTVLSVEPGKKYARIVADDSVSRSVYCFINMENGDILKAASWKAPAKHSRGNIYDPNPTAGINPYGANYMR
jgi:hypothetical protein